MTPEPTSTASTPRTPRTAGTEVADRRRGARRGRTRRATLVATTGLGVLGAGIGLGIPAAVAAPPMPRPIVRGKVAAVGTTSFTLIRGVATITVDVSPSTTYADTAVSAASLSTLAQNERVAVVGTVAGTNVVDATEVRILPGQSAAHRHARAAVGRRDGRDDRRQPGHRPH